MKKNRIIIYALLAIVAIFALTRINFSNDTNNNADIAFNPSDTSEYKINATLTIDARILDEQKDKVKEEYKKYIPEDGYFAKDVKVGLKKDASVAEVLEAYCKENNLNLELNTSSNFTFLDKINYLGAKTTSDMSGWLYMINNKMPLTGIDETKLKDKDNLLFIYSNDGGKDITKYVKYEYEEMK